MLTLHRNPPMTNPFALLDALFDGADPFGTNRFFSARSGPQFELTEEDDHYTIVGDVPGLKSDDLEVTIEDGVLTVAGQRDIDPPEGYRALRSERSTLEFSRSYELGDRIDATGADAKLVDGVLTLSLPKRAEVKPQRIEIKEA